MELLTITIGEHLFHVQCASAEITAALKRSFQWSAASADGNPDISIALEAGYGTAFTDYEVEIFEEHGELSFRRADYRIRVDSNYTRAFVAVHNELALKHALMNLYSSFIVHRGWGLLLHSSCVIENGQAHLFLGPSGAGKSTAARLSAPRELLSDEAAVLKITEDGVTAFNSPFRSELETTGHQTSCPAASMQLLIQAPANNRVRLAKPDAFVQLTDKVFYWVHGADDARRVLQLLRTAVNRVPVYALYFQKNDTFWELISS